MEKMDARKRYTQMVLKQSFLKLLKEKPVNRIKASHTHRYFTLRSNISLPEGQFHKFRRDLFR